MQWGRAALGPKGDFAGLDRIGQRGNRVLGCRQNSDLGIGDTQLVRQFDRVPQAFLSGLDVRVDVQRAIGHQQWPVRAWGGDVKHMSAARSRCPQPRRAGQQPLKKGRGVDLPLHDRLRIPGAGQFSRLRGRGSMGGVDQRQARDVPLDLVGDGFDLVGVTNQNGIGKAGLGGLADTGQGGN